MELERDSRIYWRSEKTKVSEVQEELEKKENELNSCHLKLCHCDILNPNQYIRSIEKCALFTNRVHHYECVIFF